MKKKQLRILIDTNIWSEIAKVDAGIDLVRATRKNSAEILVTPTNVEELRAIPDPAYRLKALRAITQPTWTRLMPEPYTECSELKAEIRRLRPAWVIANPNFKEVNRLRYDWVRKDGGYWGRARVDASRRITDESVRGEVEHRLARDEAKAIRKRVHDTGENGAGIHIEHVGYMPDVGTPGWSGKAVHYWRATSLFCFRTELMIYSSPYREWLDNEVDVFAMLADDESMNRLWYHELDPCHVPSHWMRGAFEFLASQHKVTAGTPGDCSFAASFPQADLVVSADKNLVSFTNRCNADAPFKTAKGIAVQGGGAGVEQVLSLVETLENV